MSVQNENRIMRDEHKILSDDLSEKLKELELDQRKLKDIESELINHKQLQEKLKTISRQKTDLEHENIKFKSKVDKLENTLHVQEKLIEETQRKYLELLNNSLHLDDIENETNNNFTQEIDQNDTIRRLTEDAKLKETSLLIKIDNLQEEVQQLKVQLNEEKQNNIKRTHSTGILRTSLSELKLNTEETRKILNLDSNENVSKNQQFSKLPVEISNLNSQIAKLSTEKDRLELSNAELRIEIDKLKLEVSTQKSEAFKLSNEIKLLESSREELINKLQSINKQRNNEERDLSLHIAEISSLKKLLVAKESEISTMKSNILNLDQANDTLQKQLEYRIKELSQIQTKNEIQNLNQSEVSKNSTEINEKLNQCEIAIKERDNEINELKQKLESALKSYNEIQETLENNEYTENYKQTSPKENTGTFNQIREQNYKDIKKAEFDIKPGSYFQLQQSLRAIETEKNEILYSYREACSEIQMLKDIVQSMNYQISNMEQHIKELESNLYHANGTINDFARDREFLVTEIQDYDKRIQSLSTQLEFANKQVYKQQDAKDGGFYERLNQQNIPLHLSNSLERTQNDYYYQNYSNYQIGSGYYNNTRFNELGTKMNWQQENIYSSYNESDRQHLKDHDRLYQDNVNSYKPYSKCIDENKEDLSFASSNNSYEYRNKENLQRVIHQLEKEVE